jgi:hypothetical protein
VPVERMEAEVVEMYAQDRRARAQEVFLPFRRFCGRRSVSPRYLLRAAAAASFVGLIDRFRVSN